MRKSNATEVPICHVYGPFIDDALQQSTEARMRGRSRKTKAKNPKTPNRRKKPGTASVQAQRRGQGKKRR
jgi:hypothetical protein